MHNWFQVEETSAVILCRLDITGCYECHSILVGLYGSEPETEMIKSQHKLASLDCKPHHFRAVVHAFAYTPVILTDV